MSSKPGIKIITLNRAARRKYFIEEKYEAGMALTGSEVKSLRAGRANLKDSYAQVRGEEVWLINSHISPYPQATIEKHEPKRDRKLLLHKYEIRRLIGKTKEKGYTLVPLAIYFKAGKAKVELGLGKGKLLYDRRREIVEETARREVERELGLRIKGREEGRGKRGKEGRRQK